MPHLEHDGNEEQDLTLPVLTMDQFAAVLDAREDAPTQAMIEAGWGVLDRAGIEAPDVETMVAVYRAMVGAR